MKNIIVDIDGTCAIVNEQRKQFSESEDWENFHKGTRGDNPIKFVCELVKNLRGIYSIVFLTMRHDTQREATHQWIEMYMDMMPGTYSLMMAQANEKRMPEIFKADIVQMIDNIAFAIEDNDNVIKAYNKIGIECLKVIDIKENIKPKIVKR